MKLAIIAVALLLPLSAAQAQMSSIADPGTPPPPSAAPATADQTGAKQKKPRRVAKSNKTVEELFEACMARHEARQRGGRNVGENCRRRAHERGR